MDFLKKNGFAVALGTLRLGALALLWFLVLGKIFGPLSTAQGDLVTVKKRYDNLLKSKEIPSEQRLLALEEARKKWDETLKEARKFFDDRNEKFEALHDKFEAQDATDVAGFKTFYNNMLDTLKKEYLALVASLAPGAAPAPDGAAPA